MAPILALALLAIPGPGLPARSLPSVPGIREDALQATLARSRRERRPVTLRVGGQPLSAQVLRLLPDAVEVRRPDRSRLLVRLDRIESAVLDDPADLKPGGPSR